VRRLDGDIKVPAKSTIHAVLDAMAWSSAEAGRAIARGARRYRRERFPTICGAPTSRASSSSAMGGTSRPRMLRTLPRLRSLLRLKLKQTPRIGAVRGSAVH
jgi:hypothetical protein